MTKLTITNYQNYLEKVYAQNQGDTGLFMKLVEEIGEVAEVLNRRDGRKETNNQMLEQLGSELVDIMHYTVAIAAINKIPLEEMLIKKDKESAKKYQRDFNLEESL